MLSTRSRRTTRGRVPRYGRHGGGRGDRDGGHLHRPGAQLQHVLLQLHGAHGPRESCSYYDALCPSGIKQIHRGLVMLFTISGILI